MHDAGDHCQKVSSVEESEKKGTYLEPSRGNGRCRRQDVCELDVFEDVEHFFTRRANERLGFSDLW